MTVKVTPRARVTKSPAAAAKVTAKKTAPAKKTASKAPATKTAARATPSRARKAAAPVVKDTPVPARGRKKAAAQFVPLQERRESMDPRKRIAGLSYKQISELTGYGLGSEQFITAIEIISGGATKLEVSHRVAALLPPTTRNGTPKAVSNLVSSVIKNLDRRGFTTIGTWKMVPPKA